MALSPLLESLKELKDVQSCGIRFIDKRTNIRRVSYAELIDRATVFAAALREKGVQAGEPVILVMTIPESAIVAILGCLIAGCPPTPIYPPQNVQAVPGFLEFVTHVMSRSGARFLVADAQPFPFLIGASKAFGELRGIEKFDRMQATSRLSFSDADNPVAFLQFTSGSTAVPKGVVVTQDAIAVNLWMIRDASHMDSRSSVVTWLPVYHDMGLIGTVLNAITLPCDLTVISPLVFLKRPRLWLEAISEFKGTHTAAPNFAYGLAVKRVPETIGLNLRNMTTFICGAEPVLPKTMENFVAHYANAGLDPGAMVAAYGLAEATLAVTFSPFLRGILTEEVDWDSLATGKAFTNGKNGNATRIASCGIPLKGMHLRIASEDGNILQERMVGEIQLQGPTISPGYIGDAEATRLSRTFDGWLRTGDLGYLANGELFVCGRIKDVIIIRGKNFHAHDIESLASEVPGVRIGNVVAFAVQQDQEESLVVVAETREETRSGEIARNIRAHVAQSIGITPDAVQVVPAGTLPKTSSGKLKRSETRRLFLEGTLERNRLSGVQDVLKSGIAYLKGRFRK